MPFSEKTLFKTDIRNATIKLREYRWNAGDDYLWHDRSHLITWRLFPATVSYGARVGTNEQTYGRLSFFPANVPVYSNAARIRQRGRSITCQFEPSWCSEISASEFSPLELDLSKLLDINATSLNQLVHKIGSEILHPQSTSDTLLTALCTTLVIELARHIHKPKKQQIRTSNTILNEKDLKRIIAFIEDNIDNPEKSLGTAHLCREFNLSPTHLRRAFKNTTGQVLQKFVAELRFAKSRALLDGPDSIKSIAYRLGFKEASAFSYAFKLKIGMTASEYRSILRN